MVPSLLGDVNTREKGSSSVPSCTYHRVADTVLLDENVLIVLVPCHKLGLQASVDAAEKLLEDTRFKSWPCSLDRIWVLVSKGTETRDSLALASAADEGALGTFAG